MGDFTIHCSQCQTETKIKFGYVYMRCMCDEDVRIIPLVDIICADKGSRGYLLSCQPKYQVNG
jgi:hypothetical protein